MSTYREQLLPELKRQKKQLKGHATIGRQIKEFMLIFSGRIFRYLAVHPALAKRDVATDEPVSKVLHNHQLTAFRYSKDTLSSTGQSWIYYIRMTHQGHSDRDLTDSISHFLSGRVSNQAMTHVRLINLIQLSLDLRIPLEYLLYGTLDTEQIALYDYCYYDELDRFCKRYLAVQMKLHQTIAHDLRTIRTKSGYSYAKLSRLIGLSRQSIYNYFNGLFYMPHDRKMLDKVIQFKKVSPVAYLRYPYLSRTVLKKASKNYVWNCQKRFKED